MTRKSELDLTTLHPYLLSHSLREDALLQALREETGKLEMARMQIAPEQGQFMALLVRLIRARKILEIGTFTGYSSICLARALEPGGQLTCCDNSEEWTQIARRYWHEAGLEDRINLALAPALETLNQLVRESAGSFDLCFIDADKTSYLDYYERALTLLRPGGLILVDNVLWGGRVADANTTDPDTVALRAFNRFLAQDKRIEISMLPIADGLTLALKR